MTAALGANLAPGRMRRAPRAAGPAASTVGGLWSAAGPAAAFLGSADMIQVFTTGGTGDIVVERSSAVDVAAPLSSGQAEAEP